MLQAIDMHTHILTGDKAKMRPDPNVPRNTEGWGHSPDEMAEMYQKHSMMAVIFDVDQETRTGVKISNVETAAWVRKYPDTFIGFGSVDPRKDAAVQEVNHCADLGLRGMKFQQATQAFCPTDPRFFPIYEACSRLNLAVLFHTGHDRHFGTPAYTAHAPFLTEATAERLIAAGAALVGIDSLNVDSTEDPRRPVHTALLRAGIPIVEHLTNLDQLPDEGFELTAVPAPIEGLGSFPVRVIARLGR